MKTARYVPKASERAAQESNRPERYGAQTEARGRENTERPDLECARYMAENYRE